MPFFLDKMDFQVKGWIPSQMLVSHEAFCDHDRSFPAQAGGFDVGFQSYQTDPKEPMWTIDDDEMTPKRKSMMKKVLVLANASGVDVTSDVVTTCCCSLS